MSPKLQFLAYAVMMLLPFVLMNLLLSLGRRVVTGLLVVFALVMLLFVLVPPAMMAKIKASLGSPRVGVPVVISAFACLVVYVCTDTRFRHTRSLKQFWRVRPDDRTFFDFGMTQLARNGWEIRADHFTAAFSACRADHGAHRLTLVFLVRPEDPQRVAGRVLQRGWDARSRRIIVTWDPPQPAFISAARSAGFEMVHGRHLDVLLRSPDAEAS